MSLFRKDPDVPNVTLDDLGLRPLDLVAMSAGMTLEQWDAWRHEHGADKIPTTREEIWALYETLRLAAPSRAVVIEGAYVESTNPDDMRASIRNA